MLDLPSLRSECERTIVFIDTLCAAAEAHSIAPELVWSRCQDDRAQDARAHVYTKLREAGWSWDLIARVFDRDIATVREVVRYRQGIKRERKERQAA